MQKEQQIFKLHAPYQPTGDQPQAIEELVRGFKEGNQFETLLGVTGSGKTPSLTVEKQKNGCKASKINACSRFLFRNDMCYCAIFFTLW